MNLKQAKKILRARVRQACRAATLSQCDPQPEAGGAVGLSRSEKVQTATGLSAPPQGGWGELTSCDATRDGGGVQSPDSSAPQQPEAGGAQNERCSPPRRAESKTHPLLGDSLRVDAENPIAVGLRSGLSLAPDCPGLSSRLTEAKTVALYSALPDEISVTHLLAGWLGKKRVVLPVVEGSEMVFREYTGPECLRRGAFGIAEPRGTNIVAPDEIDVMLVPGVAFDASGGRLGRGGGFYDRYLSQPAAARIYKVGVCRAAALVPEVPVEPHDVRMDEVLVVGG